MSFLSDYPHLKIIQDIARRKKVSIHIVGGFLRDYFLESLRGPRPHQTGLRDFDFAVERDALRISRLFADQIKGAHIVLDKDRGCARVAKKNRGKLWTFDFADFRAKTFRGDLARRDFTINTLSVDLAALDSSCEVLDAIVDTKKGLKDLKDRWIRKISNQAFKDDPLRMMRAFSLSAGLGFKIERDTLRQIKKEKDRIRGMSAERIRDELFKILRTNRAAATLKSMDKIGLLEEIIPQMRVMYDCQQGGYHHLDVWAHSLETVVQMEGIFTQMRDNQELKSYWEEFLGADRSRAALLKLAALLHDIGKPETRKKEGERMTFHAHERVGRNIVTHIAKRLKLSTRERHALEDMVLWHLRPGYLSNFKKPSEKAIYRYFRDTKVEAAGVFLLSLADQRSTRGPLTTEEDQRHHESICLDLIQRYFDQRKEKPLVRLINGDDLIRKLKLKPSPLFAKILLGVAEKQVLGQIGTRDEALALAKKIAKNLLSPC